MVVSEEVRWCGLGLLVVWWRCIRVAITEIGMTMQHRQSRRSRVLWFK